MKRKFENFGMTVRAMRLDRNLTQAQVGKMIGAHSQTVSNAERGLAAYPKPEMRAFVKKLKLDLIELELILASIVADAKISAANEWRKPLGLKP